MNATRRGTRLTCGVVFSLSGIVVLVGNIIAAVEVIRSGYYTPRLPEDPPIVHHGPEAVLLVILGLLFGGTCLVYGLYCFLKKNDWQL